MSARDVFKLLRVPHYVKNILIFIPLFFSGGVDKIDSVLTALCGFVAFSLFASSIYIINDIKDLSKDRRHPTKKHRPIASGRVSVRQALTIGVITFLLGVLCSLVINASPASYLTVALYIAINIMYSYGLKNIPIVDVAILAAGFVLRVAYGAFIIDTYVSSWLLLTILSMALYMGLGKRRNEIIGNGTKTRTVNKFYARDFLDKNMYMFSTMSIVFYSLWTVSPTVPSETVATVPLVIIVMMIYSLNIEDQSSDGDPTNVLLKSRYLALSVLIYLLAVLFIFYVR